MASVLRIANLCKSYQITNTQKQDVLKGINIEMNSGEFVGIVGESGCGKSTLLHILGGLDNNYTGSVVIKGKFIRDFSEKEMDDYRKKRVGLVFQNYNLISHMTIKENIEIAMEMSDIDKDIREARIVDLLKMVGLEHQADKMPNQLSGGQKQRVAIARALANNPTIILADEPTGALDKESTEEVTKILKKIADLGKLVIVVTHSNKVAEGCSRIITLDDGKVISDEVKGKSLDHYVVFKENEPKNIKTKQIAKLSLKNILSNKKRNLLVSIGTSIGIAAIILILALSRGLTNYVKDYFESTGNSNSIIGTKTTAIDDDDYEDIEEIDGIKEITKVHTAYFNIICNFDESSSITFDNMYTYMENFVPDLVYGNLPSNSNEIIVSTSAASQLDNKGYIGAIGKEISINYNYKTYSFIVTGIYEDEENATSYITSDIMNEYSATKNTVYVKIKDITYIDAVSSSIENYNIEVSTFSDSASTVLEYIDLGTTALTAVAAISTLVSAIMIVIVMYISVVERTQEIGILRSIGARRKDVRQIFMLEAVYLGTLGGVFGLVFAFVITLITNLVCKFSLDFTFISYNPLYYLIGLAVSVGVSTLAGIVPSNQASNLDPIEALRFE